MCSCRQSITRAIYRSSVLKLDGNSIGVFERTFINSESAGASPCRETAAHIIFPSTNPTLFVLSDKPKPSLRIPPSQSRYRRLPWKIGRFKWTSSTIGEACFKFGLRGVSVAQQMGNMVCWPRARQLLWSVVDMSLQSTLPPGCRSSQLRKETLRSSSLRGNLHAFRKPFH